MRLVREIGGEGLDDMSDSDVTEITLLENSDVPIDWCLVKDGYPLNLSRLLSLSEASVRNRTRLK